MNSSVSIAFVVFTLAFVLSMLVAAMIKVVYWTVRYLSSRMENRK